MKTNDGLGCFLTKSINTKEYRVTELIMTQEANIYVKEKIFVLTRIFVICIFIYL